MRGHSWRNEDAEGGRKLEMGEWLKKIELKGGDDGGAEVVIR